ncbi:APC family permease [Nocardioides humi]|uniref:APC family permease n=1 Tax=Nocardioides humi TaxID=449461 RepID=A0ABN1ZS75_9ACTN|nr:APC family permease [Nocardioides humi]
MSDTVNTTLRKNALGVGAIVFLVLAAVAPLTGMVVVASLAIALGNGGGTPFAFLAVATVLLLFAIGYGKMSSELVNAGGFYAFVVKGLGRPAGLAAGFIAMLGYNFFVVGTIGTSGFFMSIVIADKTGLDMPWLFWGLASIAVCYLMALRGVDFSSKILGVSLILETSILIVFDIAVLFKDGYSLSAFSFDSITSGSLSIGLLLAATGFLGFEATSLFSEEAKNPLTTVPRATYVAITLIGVILGVTTWAVVSATGVARAQDTALAHLETGDLVFSLADNYIGGFLSDLMPWLLLVSLFAAMLAFHNSASRYVFSLGRARILPSILSKTGPSGAPYVASTVQAGFAVTVAIVFALAGADPILTVVPSMLGFGTLAILVLQALAALSIVVHFRRKNDPRLGTTLIAPGLGFLGLCFAVALAFKHFDIVAGSDARAVNLLPWLLVVGLVGGIGYALYLRSNRPVVYDALSTDLERFDEALHNTAAVGR